MAERLQPKCVEQTDVLNHDAIAKPPSALEDGSRDYRGNEVDRRQPGGKEQFESIQMDHDAPVTLKGEVCLMRL
jgi:hypothetical protein